MFARVALPRPVDRLFDYSVPPGLEKAAHPGARVEVPLGRVVLRGWIVERMAASERPVVQSIRRVIDEPSLPEEFLLDDPEEGTEGAEETEDEETEKTPEAEVEDLAVEV